MSVAVSYLSLVVYATGEGGGGEGFGENRGLFQLIHAYTTYSPESLF